MKKVLHIVGGLSVGGIENWLCEYSNEYLSNYSEAEFLYFVCDNNKLDIVSRFNNAEKNIHFPKRNNFISRIVKFIKVIRENNINVIHCHTDLSSGIYSLLAKLMGVNNIIVHSHTDRRKIEINGTIFRQLYVKSMKFLISYLSNTNVAVSNEAGKSLFNNEYHIEYCGVNIKKPKENYRDAELDRLSDKSLVFHVGRFSKPKNHPFIIDLASQFQGNNSIQFVLVGNGEEYQKIESLINKHRLNNITLLGERSDVHELLGKYANCLILPSLWEGLPLTLIESQKIGIYSFSSTNVSTEADIGLVEYLDLDLALWQSKISDFILTSELKTAHCHDLFTFESNITYFHECYNGK